MAHKTLIGGTAYEITGGKTLIGGTAYSIKSGKTLVGGTAYEVGFTVMCKITIDRSNGISAALVAAEINGKTYKGGVMNTSNAEEVVPLGTKIKCTASSNRYNESKIIANGVTVAHATKTTSNDDTVGATYEHTVLGDVIMTWTQGTLTITDQ